MCRIPASAAWRRAVAWSYGHRFPSARRCRQSGSDYRQHFRNTTSTLPDWSAHRPNPGCAAIWDQSFGGAFLDQLPMPWPMSESRSVPCRKQWPYASGSCPRNVPHSDKSVSPRTLLRSRQLPTGHRWCMSAQWPSQYQQYTRKDHPAWCQTSTSW